MSQPDRIQARKLETTEAQKIQRDDLKIQTYRWILTQTKYYSYYFNSHKWIVC